VSHHRHKHPPITQRNKLQSTIKKKVRNTKKRKININLNLKNLEVNLHWS